MALPVSRPPPISHLTVPAPQSCIGTPALRTRRIPRNEQFPHTVGMESTRLVEQSAMCLTVSQQGFSAPFDPAAKQCLRGNFVGIQEQESKRRDFMRCLMRAYQEL